MANEVWGESKTFDEEKIKKKPKKKKIKNMKNRGMKKKTNSIKSKKSQSKEMKRDIKKEKPSELKQIKVFMQILGIIIVIFILLALFFGYITLQKVSNDNDNNEFTKDSDGDGLEDDWELKNNLDPENSDTDNDGMPDGWEVKFALNPLINDSGLDQDNDGYDIDNNGIVDESELFTNLEEFEYGTDPRDKDTDDDYMWDGWEVLFREKLEKLENYAWISEQPNKLHPKDPSDANEDIDYISKTVEEKVIGYQKSPDKLTNQQEFFNGTDPTNPDTDDDGLSDYDELTYHETNPLSLDTDGDKLWDGWEERYGGWKNDLNPNENDSDEDGIPDTLEDLDNDTLWNLEELLIGTSPISEDTDGDGLPDNWEAQYWISDFSYFANPKAFDSALDYDNDGLTNLQEYFNNTNPGKYDTDSDNLSDGREVLIGFNGVFINGNYSSTENDPVYFTDPTKIDTDGDGITDFEEVFFGEDNYKTNATNSDSDMDGIDDLEEIIEGSDNFKTDPRKEDSDSDWLTDKEEIDAYLGLIEGYQTHPTLSDTDIDGIIDGKEIKTDFHPFTDFDTTIYGCIDTGAIDGLNPTERDTDGDGMLDGWEASEGKISRSGYIRYIKDFDSKYGLERYGFKYLDKLNNHPEVKHVWLVNPLDHRDKYDDIDKDSYDANGDGNISTSEEFNNSREYATWQTDPLSPDSDSDGLPDGWEAYFGSEAKLLGINGPDPNVDDDDLNSDKDFITYWINNEKYIDASFNNFEEFRFGTNPIVNDTDGDGENDYHEIWFGDNDKDGLLNGWEDIFNGNDKNPVGYKPKIPMIGNFNKNNYDSDNDNISDGNEDYDLDGYNNTHEQYIFGEIDLSEIEHGKKGGGTSDPTDKDITPDSVIGQLRSKFLSRGFKSSSTIQEIETCISNNNSNLNLHFYKNIYHEFLRALDSLSIKIQPILLFCDLSCILVLKN